MPPPLPKGHVNPETTHEEPVYLFTDKATVPARGENGESAESSNDQQAKPAALPPDQEPSQ